MTISPHVHPGHGAARVALLLALTSALVNATMAVVYGWLLGAMFVSVETGEELPFDIPSLAHSTPALLMIGELWYLTPVLWLIVMVLGLRSPGMRTGIAAMIISTASLVVFAVMLMRFVTGTL